MSGSSKTPLTRKAILEAMKTPPPGGYFVWDGQDEDDRPLTSEEMHTGIALAKKAGRPSGSCKTATTIRLDDDVLEAFRATGKGWQTRVNAALKDWLKTHVPS